MEQIGRYQVLQRIAVGGMAEVFLGRVTGEGGFEKLVAIKRILGSFSADEKFVTMFMDEARISATLAHGNIGQIFEFGRAGESYFIAMEYIPGVSLRSLLRQLAASRRQPPPPMAAFIVGGVCAALEYAHTRTSASGHPLRIIHRDVSPSNVLLSFDGEVKLIDFGVAKAAHRMQETVWGDLKGKFAYMSPEQASGEELDQRSDIFSAGVVLFEMLTGRHPFRAENDMATLAAVRRAKVSLPLNTLPGEVMPLYEICVRALARDPSGRYASAGDMQEDLERYGRRQVYGSRNLSRYLREAFATEEKRQRDLMKRAAEVPPPPLAVATTEEDVPAAGGAPQRAPLAAAQTATVTDEAPRRPARRSGRVPVAGPRAPASAGATPGPAAVPTEGTLESFETGIGETTEELLAASLEEAKGGPPIPLTGGRRESTPAGLRERTPSGATERTPPGPGAPARPLPIEPRSSPRADPSHSRSGATPSGRSTSGRVAVPVGLQPVASGLMPPDQLPARTAPPRPRRAFPLWTVPVLLAGLGLLVTVVLLLGRGGGSGDRPPLGAVRVTVAPALAAQVTVDDVVRGRVVPGQPFLVEGLLAGKHRILVEQLGYRPVERIVEVVAEGEVPLVVTLEAAHDRP